MPGVVQDACIAMLLCQVFVQEGIRTLEQRFILTFEQRSVKIWGAGCVRDLLGEPSGLSKDDGGSSARGQFLKPSLEAGYS